MIKQFFLLSIFALLPLKETESITLLRSNLDQEISLELLNSYEEDLKQYDDAVSMAYLGVVNMLKSKASKFPITKYKYFSEGCKIMDLSISTEPEDVELRYLRFVFQTELPGFLGYDENREEDLSYILIHFGKADYDYAYKALMMTRMLDLSKLSEDERKLLNSINY